MHEFEVAPPGGGHRFGRSRRPCRGPGGSSVTRFVQVAALIGGSALVALGTQLADAGTNWAALALIGGAIAAGELIELRPPLRVPLPISFAFMVVLAERGVGEGRGARAARRAPGELPRAPRAVVDRRTARALRRAARRRSRRGRRVPRRRVGDRASPPSRAGELLALAAASVTPILIAEIARMVRERHISVPMHGRTADLALITSAMLMAISDQGIDGSDGMGLWGPAIFTIPLLAAWYSYEQLNVIRATYDQTIRALGAAPELGGMVREGHAERVASHGGRHRERARLLSCRDRSARDRGAAPPPRPGLYRRARGRPLARSGRGGSGGRGDSPRHPAARAGRRHHRRGADAVPGRARLRSRR